MKKHIEDLKITLTPSLNITDVSESDYFIVSTLQGYSKAQQKDAMQVMECWGKVMTVKCKGGCFTKPYNHFEKITDLTGKNVYDAPYFEDNRSHSR